MKHEFIALFTSIETGGKKFLVWQQILVSSKSNNFLHSTRSEKTVRYINLGRNHKCVKCVETVVDGCNAAYNSQFKVDFTAAQTHLHCLRPVSLP